MKVVIALLTGVVFACMFFLLSFLAHLLNQAGSQWWSLPLLVLCFYLVRFCDWFYDMTYTLWLWVVYLTRDEW